LRYTTSAISVFGDGAGYAIGSIEGRCGIVNIDLNNITAIDQRDFCFKCHRKEGQSSASSSEKQDDIYTVNCVAFNKLYNTFVSAGSDGQWCTWNKDTKSRYKQSNKSSHPITAASFSDDSAILIHCHGEDWSLGGGNKNGPPNIIKIVVRKCEKDDVFKPKK